MGANECKSELEWLERKMERDVKAVREEPGEGEGVEMFHTAARSSIIPHHDCINSCC